MPVVQQEIEASRQSRVRSMASPSLDRKQASGAVASPKKELWNLLLAALSKPPAAEIVGKVESPILSVNT
jgi:hypothetical protein